MNRNKGLTYFFIDESTGKFVLVTVFKFTLIDSSNLKFSQFIQNTFYYVFFV